MGRAEPYQELLCSLVFLMQAPALPPRSCLTLPAWNAEERVELANALVTVRMKHKKTKQAQEVEDITRPTLPTYV